MKDRIFVAKLLPHARSELASLCVVSNGSQGDLQMNNSLESSCRNTSLKKKNSACLAQVLTKTGFLICVGSADIFWESLIALNAGMEIKVKEESVFITILLA